MKSVLAVVVCLLAHCSLGVDKSAHQNTNSIESPQHQHPLNLNRLETVAGVWDYLWHIWKDVEDVVAGRIPHPFRCTECFKGLGCFDACNGTFHYVHLLPETPEQIGTAFRLYPW